MKNLIHKIISRLFFGGWEFRYNIKGFFGIPKTHLYVWPSVFMIGKGVIDNPTLYPIDMEATTLISLGIFLFMMFIIFIYFRFFPVKFKDLSRYQKWQLGIPMIAKKVPDTLTEAEWKEWEEINKEAKDIFIQ